VTAIPPFALTGRRSPMPEAAVARANTRSQHLLPVVKLVDQLYPYERSLRLVEKRF
jgi:hypothetical protein